MKKFFRNLSSILVAIFLFFLLSFTTTLAQGVSVDLQVPIGGVSQIQASDSNNPGTLLSEYISIIYTYALGVSSTLAVIMIMVGGFIWLTSAGSPDKVGLAKDFISSAITGLVIALFSYIILQTVNPRLVSNQAPSIFSPTNISSSNPSDQQTTQQVGTASDQAIRAALTAPDVGIGVKPPCPPGSTTNCVNLDGLPLAIVDDLKDLKDDCNCTLFITGGTEGTTGPNPIHDSHGVGEKIVDLRNTDPTLNSYILNTAKPIDSVYGGYDSYCIGNDLYVNEADKNHWHVEFDTDRPNSC